MPKTKRKNIFNAKLREKYPYIRLLKNQKVKVMFCIENAEAKLFGKRLKIEGDDITAIEVVHCLNECSPTALVEQQKLINGGYNSDEMTAIRKEFFAAAICYLHIWTPQL